MTATPHHPDPTIAVVIDRLDRFETFRHQERQEDREELRQMFQALREERRSDAMRLDKIETSVTDVQTTISRARGGFMVLVALGGIATWITGLFPKLWNAVSGGST